MIPFGVQQDVRSALHKEPLLEEEKQID